MILASLGVLLPILEKQGKDRYTDTHTASFTELLPQLKIAKYEDFFILLTHLPPYHYNFSLVVSRSQIPPLIVDRISYCDLVLIHHVAFVCIKSSLLGVQMKISVSVSVAIMLVQIYLYRYRQKYRLGEYIGIGIGIGQTHIGPTLIKWSYFNTSRIWSLHLM